MKIDDFLLSFELPTLGQEEQEGLNGPFTKDEIAWTLSSLQAGNSPEEDVFPIEFYKEFKDLLMPHLMTVVDQAAETHTLPESFSTAIITMIPKKTGTH